MRFTRNADDTLPLNRSAGLPGGGSIREGGLATFSTTHKPWNAIPIHFDMPQNTKTTRLAPLVLAGIQVVPVNVQVILQSTQPFRYGSCLLIFVYMRGAREN